MKRVLSAMLASIVVSAVSCLALVCLAAEAYSGYIIIRQLWRWCGIGVRVLFRPDPELQLF